MNAIEFENVGKQYRLGLVSTGTISHDLNRWWSMNILHKEDPYLKIGETNDRSHKGQSDYVWALKDINFSIEEGDVVGIIGKNGAGKSTLLKLLSRVTAPTTGLIRARGRIASLLEVGTGFHPEMTGRENIYLNGAIMGMTKAEISRKLDEIVDFSGCERYIDTPVKRYSSGMTVRLGFAIAAHLEPEILVVDEVLAVGDAEFQKKAIGKMQDVSKGGGRTVLFVSHNMASVKALCNKGILLRNGMVQYQGSIIDTVNEYLSYNVLKNKDNRLVNTFKIMDSSLTINDFTINGSQSCDIDLEFPERILKIEIKGHFDGNAKLDIESSLFSEDEVLVAKKTPALSTGETVSVDNSDFLLKQIIEIPKVITNGSYLLRLDITHPKIQAFASTEFPVRLNITGHYTPQGVSVDKRIFGFLYL